MGGSHNYELPDGIFDRFNDMLVVTKMHLHGSSQNARVLHKAQVKYVVLYRDLRDVAVSYYFYVRQTPWHPAYPLYSKLSLQEGLALFGIRLLPDFALWVRSWYKNLDPSLGLMLRYEDILKNTLEVMTRVAKHLHLNSSYETVSAMVEKHSFQQLSGGRKQGQESTDSFFRKGKAGDWRNHFTPALKAMYKKSVGDFLIEFGYEQDYSW
jgi:hypothetical protein